MRETPNTRIVRRLFDDVFNKLDQQVAEIIVAPDYVGHDPPNSPGTIRGPEGMLQSARTMRAIFPDGEFVSQAVVANGDLVTARVQFQGTHRGELALPSGPFAPTGRRVTIGGVVIYRCKNDQIAETWGCWDMFGLLTQVGAVTFANGSPAG